uniref:Bis(5'-nucleosyl)-tetraphosphatase [asymmetrical] n=1 Tax=Lygus hesperus TaxID=30085 RepID=A0A0A9VRK4_LYGHE
MFQQLGLSLSYLVLLKLTHVRCFLSILDDMMAEGSVVRAAGFIVYKMLNDKVHYLLLQSSKKPHHWTPPKGHLEEGETDLDAAYRETNEEAGLLKDQLRLIDSQIPLKYTANGKPKVVTYWIAELIDENAAVKISHEHQDYSWADYDKAFELVSYVDAQSLLNKCNDLIKEELQKNAK